MVVNSCFMLKKEGEQVLTDHFPSDAHVHNYKRR